MSTTRVWEPVKVVSDRAVVTVAAPPDNLAVSLKAASRLLEYLKDAGAVIGYRVPPDTRITEIRGDGGTIGHAVLLKAPSSGFLPVCRVAIEDYVEALSVYNRLDFTVEWGEPTSTVSLRPVDPTVAEATRESFRKRVRDLFLPHVYKACRGMGRALVAQGFRVREPVAATLITYKSEVHGYAIMVKYPYPRAEDKAGITEVYNRVLPYMADAHARECRLRAETLREDDTMMMFFTRSRQFVPTIYETRPVLAPVIVRRPRASALEFALLPGAPYRACRKLIAKFKKDFTILKRPMPALHLKGHTVVLRYKLGAGGRLVYDAYMTVVGRAAEALATRHHVQVSLRHSLEARMLIVTFHYGAPSHWNTSKLYLT